MASYLGDSDISLDDEIQVNNAEEAEVVGQQIDRTLGRTAPVFNSFQANTAFQVISDTKQDWVDPLTGKINSVKYELGDDLIIKVEQNNNLSSPIYNMTIYKGIFTYDGSKLARTEVNELITGSVSDAWEGYSYWNFSEPKAFVLQRAASFTQVFDEFPAAISTDKDYVTQKSDGLLDGKWHENLFEQNRIV